MDIYTKKLRELKRKTRNRDIKIKINLFLLAIRLKNVREACERRGFSRTFYYKWWNRLRKSNFKLEALDEESRRPRKSPNKIKRCYEEWIIQLGKYGEGARRIEAFLAKRNIDISHTTINHVLNHRKKQKKKRSRRLKAHRRRYELPIPGLRLQLDVKYVPDPIAGERAYNYVAIDECTRWRFAWAYNALNEHSTVDFLDRLIAICPFPIFCIQTDHGFEFTYDLNPHHHVREHYMDTWCNEHGIRHRLIPPGEKELNGKVERSHRIDMQYFYWRANHNSLAIFNKDQKAWLHYYNTERMHGGLNYLTPNEKILERMLELGRESVRDEWQFFKLRFLKERTNIAKRLRQKLGRLKKFKLAA